MFLCAPENVFIVFLSEAEAVTIFYGFLVRIHKTFLSIFLQKFLKQ
jgi:hypothetical protein